MGNMVKYDVFPATVFNENVHKKSLKILLRNLTPTNALTAIAIKMHIEVNSMTNPTFVPNAMCRAVGILNHQITENFHLSLRNKAHIKR